MIPNEFHIICEQLLTCFFTLISSPCEYHNIDKPCPWFDLRLELEMLGFPTPPRCAGAGKLEIRWDPVLLSKLKPKRCGTKGPPRDQRTKWPKAWRGKGKLRFLQILGVSWRDFNGFHHISSIFHGKGRDPMEKDTLDASFCTLFLWFLDP